MTQLTTLPRPRFEAIPPAHRRGGGRGDGAAVHRPLPHGRHLDHDIIRGVVPVHKMLGHGVNCSLSSNNVLNPFTPFGDCSLLPMANLYANICQVGQRDHRIECFEMVTRRSARLLGLKDHGVAVGNPANCVVFDCPDRASAVAELAPPLYGFKRGHMTFNRAPARLLRPQ